MNFEKYFTEGFKPIFCKGFTQKFNPHKNYKTAKEPFSTGFTKDNYKPPTIEEIQGWLKEGGWIGWLIPEGLLALDAEDATAIAYIEKLCKRHGISPSVHNTDRGKHYLFRTQKAMPGASKINTKSGVPVTYRAGGKNYLILAPISGRTWAVWKSSAELPELPPELHPYDRNNKVEVMLSLAWAIGEHLRAKTLHGFDDIDTAFMAFLIDRGFTQGQINKAFKLVFASEYDPRQTDIMYNRTKTKMENHEPIKGPGSFVQKIKDMGLKGVEVFIRQLQPNDVSDCSDIGGGHVDTSINTPFSYLKRGADLRTLDIKIKWCVDKLLPKESITLLHGKGGIGKTWLCLILADCISRGLPFMGLDTENLSVIFVDFENSLPVLVDRVRKIGIDDVLFWHNADLELKPPKIDREDWEQYKALPPGSLLIFDTLRASQGLDENDSQKMAFVMSRLKELRDMGFTILLLHHTPKGNDRTYKGSTAILDLADHVLSLHKVKKGNPEGGEVDDEDDTDCLYRLGTKDKTRYEPFHVFMAFDKEKGFVKAEDPSEDDLREIYNILKEHPRLNQKAIFESAKNELDIKSKGKVISLLKKGEGKYWTSCREGKAVFYEALPCVHVSTPIYSQTGHINNDTKDVSRTERTDALFDTMQTLDTSHVSNCPDTFQTDRTDAIFIDAEVE